MEKSSVYGLNQIKDKFFDTNSLIHNDTRILLKFLKPHCATMRAKKEFRKLTLKKGENGRLKFVLNFIINGLRNVQIDI